MRPQTGFVADIVINHRFRHGRSQEVCRACVQVERRGLQHVSRERHHAAGEIVRGISLEVRRAAQIVVDGRDAMARDGQLAVDLQVNQAIRTRIRHRGTGFDVVNRVAVKCAFRDVLCVEMAREHRFHAVAGKQRRDAGVVVHDVFREQRLLAGEMFQQPMVHHADDDFAVGLRVGEFVGDPVQALSVE